MPDATAQLTAIVSGLNFDSQRVLIKAFGNYFQLINIAEDLQRIRALRQREVERQSTSESIDEAVGTLHEAGVGRGRDVRALLG